MLLHLVALTHLLSLLLLCLQQLITLGRLYHGHGGLVVPVLLDLLQGVLIISIILVDPILMDSTMHGSLVS